MNVVYSGRKFKVYWMYNDSYLPALLRKIGASNEDVEKMSKISLKKQIEYWEEKFPGSLNTKDYPAPDTTWCFILEDGKPFVEASVVRYYKDPEDRDKARKYSLAKALRQVFPNREEKEVRVKFWESYLNRCIMPVKELRVV